MMTHPIFSNNIHLFPSIRHLAFPSIPLDRKPLALDYGQNTNNANVNGTVVIFYSHSEKVFPSVSYVAMKCEEIKETAIARDTDDI